MSRTSPRWLPPNDQRLLTPLKGPPRAASPHLPLRLLCGPHRLVSPAAVVIPDFPRHPRPGPDLLAAASGPPTSHDRSRLLPIAARKASRAGLSPSSAGLAGTPFALGRNSASMALMQRRNNVASPGGHPAVYLSMLAAGIGPTPCPKCRSDPSSWKATSQSS